MYTAIISGGKPFGSGSLINVGLSVSKLLINSMFPERMALKRAVVFKGLYFIMDDIDSYEIRTSRYIYQIDNMYRYI